MGPARRATVGAGGRLCHHLRRLRTCPASLPPTTVEPFVSASAASGLVVYVSADGRFSQLAPRNWICSAGIGADGGWDLTIHPLSDPSATVETGGHFGVQAGYAAAALFPAAHQMCLQQNAGLGYANCPGPPPEEVIDRRSPSLVYVSDPPGVVSSLEDVPSAPGAYTTLGAMTFVAGIESNDASPDSETHVVCALPDSQRSLCQAIVDATTSSWAGQH